MSSFNPFKLCLVAVLWTAGQGDVLKRSDDPDPLAVVVENLARDLAKTQAKLESQGQIIAALQASMNHPVAFSAYISDEPSIQASKGSAVPFRGVVTNVGGGYSTSTSAFTVPISGLYFFIVHVDCSTDYRALFVTVNGHTAIAADNDASDGHVTGSELLTLTAGDVVTTSHYTSVGFIDAGRESTFTGFLVR